MKFPSSLLRFQTILFLRHTLTLAAALSLHALILNLACAYPIRGKSPVTYITDIEGKGSKWRDFLTQNPDIWRDKRTGELKLKPGSTFVYGGDAIDQGPQGMQMVSELLGLKRKYPDQVILIAGNRDLNKLRLPFELSPEAMTQIPAAMKPWLREKMSKAQGLPEASLVDDSMFARLRTTFNTTENRLKWILEKTMGAPRAFEFRRSELAQKKHLNRSKVSDEQVLKSYQRDLAPGGDLREYLMQTQLSYRNGETFFVHGAVTESNFGVVPGPPERVSETLDEWNKELNEWHGRQLSQWQQGIASGPGLRPAEELIRYQEPARPGGINEKSVVYNRYSDASRNPYLPSEITRQKLKDAGVNRVVVGHTPNGDSPTVIRDKNFEVIIADNTESPHGTLLSIEGDQVRIRSKTRFGVQSNTKGPWHDIDMTWKIGDKINLGTRETGEQWISKGMTLDGRTIAYKVGEGNQVLQVKMRSASGSECFKVKDVLEKAFVSKIKNR